MDLELLEKYSDIALEIRTLEAKKSMYAKEVIEHMKQQNIDTFTGDLGTFSIAHRKTYKYSDLVTKLEQQVKTKKKEEQQTGVATQSQTEFLVYKV